MRITSQKQADKLIKDGVLGCMGDLEITCDIDIRAHLIVDGSIAAENITAETISAWDINAGNVTAGNVSAWDIKARDIDYYAVCFAHINITCRSIKGRRENSKHFCLDGEITIEGKKHTIAIDGKEIEISEDSFNKLKESL